MRKTSSFITGYSPKSKLLLEELQHVLDRIAEKNARKPLSAPRNSQAKRRQLRASALPDERMR
jgi:hypothetical protein